MIRMNDKFNKKLSEKIRKEFENFSVPYNAENWEKLEQRLFSIRRKRVLRYTVGIAACMGLILVSLDLAGIYQRVFHNKEISRDITDHTIESRKLTYTVLDSMKTSRQQEGKLTGMTAVSLSADDNIHKEKRVQQRETNENIVMSDETIKNTYSPIVHKRIISRQPESLKTHSVLSPGIRYTQSVSEKRNKAIKLGVVLSPQVSHAANDYTSEISVTGGISSEFPLFAQLALDVGVLLSSQNIGIDSEIENSWKTEIYGNAQSKKTDVRLLALDIPINIKYNLVDNRGSSLFVSAGISSMIYFKENYTNEYYSENILAIDENAERNITVYKEEEKSIPAFNRVDAAKILNISLGIMYSFRNGMDVQIEPFIKYPLAPVTSENIKLGSGGILFRVYF